MSDTQSAHAAIPSVDKLLRAPDGAALIHAYGRQPVTEAVRADLATLRRRIATDGDGASAPTSAAASGSPNAGGEDPIAARAKALCEAAKQEAAEKCKSAGNLAAAAAAKPAAKPASPGSSG